MSDDLYETDTSSGKAKPEPVKQPQACPLPFILPDPRFPTTQHFDRLASDGRLTQSFR